LLHPKLLWPAFPPPFPWAVEGPALPFLR
jgi:hypothetical protein